MWPWRNKTQTNCAANEHESAFLLEVASIDLGEWQIRHKNPRNNSITLADPPDYYMLVFETEGCKLQFYHHADTQDCRIVLNGEEVYYGRDQRLIDLWERIFNFGRLSDVERRYARAAQTLRQARTLPPLPRRG